MLEKCWNTASAQREPRAAVDAMMRVLELPMAEIVKKHTEISIYQLLYFHAGKSTTETFRIAKSALH